MTRAKWIIAALGIAALFGVSLLIYILTGINDRAAAGKPVLFEVRAGESFSSVKQRLAAESLIDHPRAVSLFAKLRRYDRQIMAGTYQLTPGDRARDLLGTLVRGEVYTVTVTIPEGFMAREIAGVLASAANIDSVAFASVYDDDEFVNSEVGIEGGSLEGYLFPDTYRLPWGAPPKYVARTMVKRFEDVFDEAAAVRARELGMSRHELVTLASIVQAETRLHHEFPLVSAVYHNRLRIGMRLEADPTVAYAMGGYRGRLFYRDLEIESPYNTYKVSGLPPGPICSPGEDAIMATLNPDTTCRAIYFVAEGNGGHIFSRTLAEHIDAVDKVRRARSRK
jgi:UPF0755 protein